MDAIRWVQDLPFSTWNRESAWAVFAWLILHMWGLALLVGGGLLVAGRNLGLAGSISQQQFARFVPVMWTGFGFALVSGVLLLMAYPAKALTNPIFYVKFACLACAAILTAQLLKSAQPQRAKAIAVIALWVGLIACGNLLKYTHHVLLVY